MMTNAEKYLKDGVDIKEFANEYADYYADETVKRPVVIRQNLVEFLNKSETPILTEEERIILRNIKEFNYIGRNEDNDLYLLFKYSETYTEKHYIDMFRHLFQFIGERRRI